MKIPIKTGRKPHLQTPPKNQIKTSTVERDEKLKLIFIIESNVILISTKKQEKSENFIRLENS